MHMQGSFDAAQRIGTQLTGGAAETFRNASELLATLYQILGGRSPVSSSALLVGMQLMLGKFPAVPVVKHANGRHLDGSRGQFVREGATSARREASTPTATVQWGIQRSGW